MALKFSPHFVILGCPESDELRFAKGKTKAPRSGMSCTKPHRVYLVATSFFLGFCSIYCPFSFDHLFFSEKQTKTRSPALLSLLSMVSMFRQMLRFSVLV